MNLLCVMRLIALQLLISILSCTGLLSQETRNGPHNGQLKRVGYYNVEVVDCSGYLEIYLFDTRMNPLRNYGMSGAVDFHYPDSTCVTAKLYHYGVDGFTAHPEQQLYASCEVFLRGHGLNIRAVFKDIVCVRPEE